MDFEPGPSGGKSKAWYRRKESEEYQASVTQSTFGYPCQFQEGATFSLVGANMAFLEINTTATRRPPVATTRQFASTNKERYRGGIFA
ncbi:MAG: hypothetical protein Q9186_003914 [Xanthomendoza sp. 1 TL-2023]